MADSTDNARPLGPWQAFPAAPSPDVLDDPRVQELVAVVQKAKLILAEYEPYPLPVLHELHTALARITDTGGKADG